MEVTGSPADQARFRADCARCAGLCCVALERTRAGGFGADIPAGTPCHHLRQDHLCEIHATLRRDGWPACTVFDCCGAGQQTVQVTFGGRRGGDGVRPAALDWRQDPGLAQEVFAVFGVQRQLMEVLSHLAADLRLVRGAQAHPGRVRERVPEGLCEELVALVGEVELLVAAGPRELLAVDVSHVRARVLPVLQQVSRWWRAPVRGSRRIGPGAMLLGAGLAGRNLSRVDLHGAVLIAADLRGAQLRRVDLLGADLRDARVQGANLAGALHLTQGQVNATLGDQDTVLPRGFERPGHWVAGHPPHGVPTAPGITDGARSGTVDEEEDQ